MLGYLDAMSSRLGESTRRFRELASVVIVAQSMQNVGRQVLRLRDVLINQTIEPALRHYGNFEKQMTQVRFVTRATAEEFRALNDATISVRRQMPLFSRTQAGSGLYELASAGLTARQSIAALPHTFAIAANSFGELGIAESADIMSIALNKFGIEANNAGHLVDVMAGAVAGSRFKMSDFLGFFDSLRGAPQTIGMTVEESVAMGMALMNAGRSARDSANDIAGLTRRFAVLSSIQERAQLSRSNTITRVTVASMERLGVQVFDTAGKLRRIPEILNDVSQAMAGMTDKRRITDLQRVFGQQGISVLSALAAHGEDLGATVRSLNNDFEGFGQEGARAMLNTLEGVKIQWEATKESLAIGFGEAFAPAAKTALRIFSGATDFVARLAEAMPILKTLAGVSLAATAAMATVLGTTLVAAGGFIAFIAPLGMLAHMLGSLPVMFQTASFYATRAAGSFMQFATAGLGGPARAGHFMRASRTMDYEQLHQQRARNAMERAAAEASKPKPSRRKIEAHEAMAAMWVAGGVHPRTGRRVPGIQELRGRAKGHLSAGMAAAWSAMPVNMTQLNAQTAKIGPALGKAAASVGRFAMAWGWVPLVVAGLYAIWEPLERVPQVFRNLESGVLGTTGLITKGIEGIGFAAAGMVGMLTKLAINIPRLLYHTVVQGAKTAVRVTMGVTGQVSNTISHIRNAMFSSIHGALMGGNDVLAGTFLEGAKSYEEVMRRNREFFAHNKIEVSLKPGQQRGGPGFFEPGGFVQRMQQGLPGQVANILGAAAVAVVAKRGFGALVRSAGTKLTGWAAARATAATAGPLANTVGGLGPGYAAFLRGQAATAQRASRVPRAAARVGSFLTGAGNFSVSAAGGLKTVIASGVSIGVRWLGSLFMKLVPWLAFAHAAWQAFKIFAESPHTMDRMNRGALEYEAPRMTREEQMKLLERTPGQPGIPLAQIRQNIGRLTAEQSAFLAERTAQANRVRNPWESAVPNVSMSQLLQARPDAMLGFGMSRDRRRGMALTAEERDMRMAVGQRVWGREQGGVLAQLNELTNRPDLLQQGINQMGRENFDLMVRNAYITAFRQMEAHLAPVNADQQVSLLAQIKINTGKLVDQGRDERAMMNANWPMVRQGLMTRLSTMATDRRQALPEYERPATSYGQHINANTAYFARGGAAGYGANGQPIIIEDNSVTEVHVGGQRVENNSLRLVKSANARVKRDSHERFGGPR